MSNMCLIDENIDYSNINHLLHVLRNPYGWNDHIIETVRLKAADELERLAIGNDRYETARLLSPMDWQDAWESSVSTGKRFDKIIDELKPFVRPNVKMED
jgi:hypothetical protein